METCLMCKGAIVSDMCINLIKSFASSARLRNLWDSIREG